MKNFLLSWPNSPIIDVLKIRLPIIQAPMAGGATTPQLVAAASNAGGLGSLGAGYLTPDKIRESIHQIKALTDKPFAVNLFIPEAHNATSTQIKAANEVIRVCAKELNYATPAIEPPYTPAFDEQIAVILEEKIPIFSFTFGIPADKWLTTCKAEKVKLIGTATNLLEAKQLEEKGIDIIVAQGSEAGGHRGTFVGTAEDALNGIATLLPLFKDNLNVPVIASGGIMDARGILAALILGASGVQMGTAFLSCSESGIHPDYKKILLKTNQDNTTLTRAFSGKLA